MNALAGARRIAVVGCSGAGKSRLSVELGRRLGLPVLHLDAAYWQPDWQETPHEAWVARQPELLAGESWVADGNFHRTMSYRTALADAIVFLDLPRRTCLRGVLGRLVRNRGRVRPDLAPGCPERFDWAFLRWVWRWQRDVRPEVIALLEAFAARGGRVETLKSRRAVDAFVAELGAVAP